MIMTMISIELEWFYTMWEPATISSLSEVRGGLETLKLFRSEDSLLGILFLIGAVCTKSR